MSEGRLGTEVSDGKGFLQRQGAGHNLAIDGSQGLILHRAMVETADALQHRSLAVRRVDFLAGLDLDLADSENVTGAFVEQLDDLRIELVDRLAMVRDIHVERREAEWRPGDLESG